MRALGWRVAAIHRRTAPRPSSTFLAYARAVVTYGGGEPGSTAFDGAADGLARWLESGGRAT